MSLLVTGGAGFIGATSSAAGAQREPDERLVVLDALTYAGNLASLDGVERRRPSCAATSATAPLVEATLRDHAVDAIVHFAAESHVDRSILGPGAVRAAPTSSAPRRCWRRRAPPASNASCTSPPTRSTATSGPTIRRSPRRRRSARARPIRRRRPAPITWCAPSSRPTSFPTLITRCSNNYGPYQFPEKLIPLMILNAHGRQAAAGLRRRHERARLDPRRGSLRRRRARARGGPRRRGLQHRRARGASRTSRSCAPSCARSASPSR